MKLLIQDFPACLIFLGLKSRDFNDWSSIFPVSVVRFPLLDYFIFIEIKRFQLLIQDFPAWLIFWGLKSRDFNDRSSIFSSFCGSVSSFGLFHFHWNQEISMKLLIQDLSVWLFFFRLEFSVSLKSRDFNEAADWAIWNNKWSLKPPVSSFLNSRKL